MSHSIWSGISAAAGQLASVFTCRAIQPRFVHAHGPAGRPSVSRPNRNRSSRPSCLQNSQNRPAAGRRSIHCGASRRLLPAQPIRAPRAWGSRLTCAAACRCDGSAPPRQPLQQIPSYGRSRLIWAAAQLAGSGRRDARCAAGGRAGPPLRRSPWALARLYRQAASRNRPRFSATQPSLCQVGRVGGARYRRPESGRDQLASGPAAVLVEIVGQLPRWLAAGDGRGTGAEPDRCQWPADPSKGPRCRPAPVADRHLAARDARSADAIQNSQLPGDPGL